jgi:hypothetical protein
LAINIKLSLLETLRGELIDNSENGCVLNLACDEALGIQWRNGRIGVYANVGGILLR